MEPSFHPDLSVVERQDIDQEVALLKLQGVEHPNRSLIYKRLARQEFASFDEMPESMSFSPVFDSGPETDPFVIERLVNWAMEQEDDIATIVFEFLDEPSEDSLQDAMTRLTDAGISLEEVQPTKEKTLTEFLLDRLFHNDFTVDELYSLARTEYISRRPEAAVRQFIRRLSAAGRIIQHGETIQYNHQWGRGS